MFSSLNIFLFNIQYTFKYLEPGYPDYLKINANYQTIENLTR